MIYVDVAPLYDLGQIGELAVLAELEGVVVPEAVVAEVTVEPAATNLERFLREHDVTTEPAVEEWLADARGLLGESEVTSDAYIVAGLLEARDREGSAGLISDDRRLRAVADGLGATVTGTFGIVTRASAMDNSLSPSQAKRVLRRTDDHGLQMTGRLRERAVGGIE